MIPLLATIISIYCCLRLVEMGIASRERQSKEALAQFVDVSWLLYFAGAIVIAILCFVIIRNGVDLAEQQKNLDAESLRIQRELKTNLQKSNDSLEELRRRLQTDFR
jgi:hypothetical protein